jgi:putative transposase
MDSKEGKQMSQKRHSAEQIINKLRQVEVELAKGARVVEACKKIGVTDHTYYRWRAEYGGMRVDQAKRLKELEKENARLKKLVAEQALDNAILKEAAAGNY